MANVGVAGSAQHAPAHLQSAIPAGLLVVGLFALSRAAMYCILALARPDLTGIGSVQLLCQWDCGWYLHTIQGGYDLAPHAHPLGDAANWAFFPAYILIVSAVWKALAVSPMVAGLLVSNIAALAAGFVMARFTEDRRILIAFCTVLYFGPFSFYFASVYTESVFVLLTLTCFYCLSRRQYLAAAAMAALLSGTRAVGVFMVLTIIASALRDHLSDGRSLRSFPQAALRNPELVLAVFLAPLGLFIFMAYLHAHTGDALAFSHIQRAWNRELGNPFAMLFQGLRANDLSKIAENGMSAQWCAIWSLLALMLTGVMLWRRQLPEALFALFCILIPLSTGTDSMPRYIIGIAPLLVLASQTVASSRTTMIVTLPMLIAGNVPLLVLWAKGHSVLI